MALDQASTYAAGNSCDAPRYKWWVVFMLWWVCFFNYADRQSIFSVFPKLQSEFHFDKFQLGLIASAFMWVYALAAPLAGFLGDRVRRTRLILGGCLFWSLVTMMTGWCQKLWQFIAVRALEGFGETFYFPASMSLISDYHTVRTRSRALSFHQSSVYVGTIIGGWWGGWFAERYGWRTGFYFFGGAGILLVLALSHWLREPQRGQSEQEIENSNSAAVPMQPLSWSETCRILFRSPVVVCLMAAFIGANFVATVFLAWTPDFLVEKFNFRLASAGLSGTLFIHLASALSAPLGGLLADRLARSWRGGRMFVQLAGLLAGAVFVFFIGTTGDVSWLLVTMAGFGFCKGLYDSNIFASLYDVVEPRARATAAGVMNSVGWAGGALGPLAVGWLAKHGRHESEIDNMSEALASGAGVYIAAAVFVMAAIVLLSRRNSVLEMN